MHNQPENDDSREWMIQYIRGIMVQGNAYVEREMLEFMRLLPESVIEDIKEEHEFICPPPPMDMVFPVRQAKRGFVPFQHSVPREIQLN